MQAKMDRRASSVLLLIFILGNTRLPGTDVEMGGGGAETSALPGILSATVEGKSSTTKLRCGAARSRP